MATFLFVAISVIFIGLGIPDSILGSAWPAVYTDFGIPVSSASFVTMIVSGCTMLSSFFSARIINRIGIGIVTAVSTMLTAISLIGFALSPSLLWLCVFAVPSGLGAGAIDAGLNNYVALRYKSSHMSFLHCFYGIGVTISPYFMSLALSITDSWRTGYRIVFLVQLVISIVAIAVLPFWKKVEVKNVKGEEFAPITMSYKSMAKVRPIRIAWIAFFATVALEYTCGTWSTTYLTDKGLSNDVAAKYLSFYYIGITVGRFVSGIVTVKLKNVTVIKIGYTIVGIALLLFVLPLPLTVKAVCLFMIGFGNGPTFPNLVYLTPYLFGKERSQSIVGSWLVVSNFAMFIMPPVFGAMAQFLTAKMLPYFLIACYLLMIVATFAYLKSSKKVSFDRVQTERTEK